MKNLGTVDITLTATAPPAPGSEPCSGDVARVSLPAPSDRYAALANQLPVVPRSVYEIGEPVAQGGIGRVSRARDARLGRSVALKELLVREEALEQRFVREALVTAGLQHPAIVPVYEAGRWPDGEPFYTMKLVSGRTLLELIAESPTLVARLALLPHVLTVAQAVAYAHGRHVLHRDLKPSNVIVGAFGETVVIDWGVAKRIAEPEPPSSDRTAPVSGDGITVVGSVVGTPSYMPPEQARGEAVDERADIYALGAMLYHLVAAVPPYHGVPADRLLTTIARSPPRPVDALAPNAPVDLSTIIRKAMARDPRDRYPTAKALADDLERFQTGQIVAAHSYSTAQLFRRFWRRYRIAVGGAATAVTLILAVIVVALVKTEASRQVAIAQRRKAESAEGSAQASERAAQDSERRATARADQLTLLHAESFVARDPNTAVAWLKTLSPSFTDVESARRIAAEALGHGLGRVYRGHRATIGDLVLLAGAKRFVTTSDDHTIRIWDVDGESSRVLEGHTDEVWYAAAFPDGDRIVSCSRDKTARIWRLSTGAVEATVSIPAPGPLTLRADGAVVGRTGRAGGPPWVWSPGATTVRLLADSPEHIATSALSADGRRAVIETQDRIAFVIDTESGARHALAPPFAERGTWTLSYDGRAAVRTRANRQGIWEYEIWDLDARKQYVVAMPGFETKATFSRRGDLVALVTEERLEVIEAHGGAVVHLFPGPQAAPSYVTFSDEARSLAVGVFDGTVSTWDLTSGYTRTHTGLEGAVGKIVFLPDQQTFLASSWGGGVRLFNATRNGAVLTEHAAKASGLALSADGRVASMDENGSLHIVDLSGKAIAEHALGKRANPVLTSSPERRRFAGTWLTCVDYDLCPPAQASGALFIGSFDGARPLIVPTPAGVRAIAWRSEADGVIVSLLDGTVRSVHPDGKMTTIDRLPAPAAELAVSDDARLLATGGDDGLVRVLDLVAGTQRDLGRHGDRIEALKFAPGGALLASSGRDKRLRLWRTADGSFAAHLSTAAVRHLAFSSDGKVLAGASRVGLSLQRWSIDTGTELPPFTGHRGPLTTLSFSRDGRYVLTGSEDRTARIFDAATGRSRALQGHKGPVVAAEFAAGGKQIVTLGEEGTVRVWPDDLPADMQALRAALEAATGDRVEGL